jgi:hypothetical protein
MNKLKIIVFALCCVCIFLPVTVTADNFDGSKKLLSVITEGIECGPDGECLEVMPEDLNIPAFLNINFKEKTISGTRENGELASTKIENMLRMDGKLILQGAENGRGWSMVITEATGKMVLTASGDQVGFILFGTCIPD